MKVAFLNIPVDRQVIEPYFPRADEIRYCNHMNEVYDFFSGDDNDTHIFVPSDKESQLANELRPLVDKGTFVFPVHTETLPTTATSHTDILDWLSGQTISPVIAEKEEDTFTEEQNVAERAYKARRSLPYVEEDETEEIDEPSSTITNVEPQEEPTPLNPQEETPSPSTPASELNPESEVTKASNPLLDIISDDSWQESDTQNGYAESSPISYETARIPDISKDVAIGERAILEDEIARKEEQARKQRRPYSPSKHGFLMTVTSAFGGGGKTTVSYYSAQLMSLALKNARNTSTQVILIEADYGNPKLQERLNIPAGKDLSKLANFLEDVYKGKIPKNQVNKQAEEIIEDIIFDDGNGVHVIACPYDSTTANPRFLKEALKKTVLWAQRTQGYFVIVDADTIGLAEGVELDIIEMSNRVIVVTNTRAPVESKKGWFRKAEVDTSNPDNRSHLNDAKNMISRFIRPVEDRGFGIPGNRIRVFFNETSTEELNKKVLEKDEFPKNMVVGCLPKIPEIERAWASDISRNQNRAIAVARQMTEFLLRVTGYREVDQLLKTMG